MKKLKKIATVLLILSILVENPQIVHAQDYYRELPEQMLAMTTLFEKEGTVEDDGFEFHLNYVLNGGINNPLNPERYDIRQLPFKLTIPSRNGYNFAGWYTNSDYTEKITDITMQNCDNYTLYARWVRKINTRTNVELYSYQTSYMIGDKNRKLRGCDYEILDDIQIPGMPETREMDMLTERISGENQCPQGICVTPEYILVTAYCVDGGKMGSLHVFDRYTGEYLVTMGMKSTSHLGGVAFDGTYIWICHSDSQSLERVSYQYVRFLANRRPHKCIDCTESIIECRVENRPSCVTYYDGKLWVATQTVFFKSVLCAYEYDEGRLKLVDRYRIPEKVQGIAFGTNGNVYLSTSLGRSHSSFLKIYDSVEKMSNAPAKPVCKVEMPPCSEEIDCVQGKLYVLFESASKKYLEGTDGKGTSSSPIDKILTIQLASLR